MSLQLAAVKRGQMLALCLPRGATDDMLLKLTSRGLSSLPSEGPFVAWDTELTGFGLRQSAAGRRSWCVQYRNKHGRSRRLTLGGYPKLAPAEARALAREAFVQVAHGEDPAEDRAANRHAITVKDAVEAYLDQHVDVHLKPSSAHEYRSALEKHLVPAVGSQPVGQVRRTAIGRMHYKMRATPTHANRVVRMSSAFFSWAGRMGYVPEGAPNPARGVTMYKENKRDRYLSPEEFSALGAAIRKLVDDGAIGTTAATAVLFLALTGLRRGEALGLRWADVDLRRGTARLRDTKTGSRDLVLNSAAAGLLAGRAERFGTAGEWVFPGKRKGRPLANLSKPWIKIRDEAELGDLRIHDLRHAFASVGVQSHLGLPIVGGLLGHRTPTTTARYAHLADDPLREASERIGRTISAALEGREDATVIPLRPGGER